MRSRLVRYFKDNVVAFLALFLAMGGTSAYAVNTIRSTDIVDGEVKSVDIANQSITSSDVQDGSINTFDVAHIAGVDILDNDLTGDDIKNGSLKDVDIAERTIVDFGANIGVVPAQDCVELQVTGFDARFDHLVLTPKDFESDDRLIYSAKFNTVTEGAVLQVCNPTTAAINDGTTRFNLLVIADA